MKSKKTYKNDSELYYLGNTYTLLITNIPEIRVHENQILFPLGAQFRIKKELAIWYKQQAREVITRRLVHHAGKMHKTYAGLRFSDTSSKWGSCFHDNSLQFNWRLIMAPLPILDYVVIHELAHTEHKNHGSDFWKEVSKYTPAYRQHKKWLNEQSEMIHASI